MWLTLFDMREEVWTLGAGGRSTDSTRQDKRENNTQQIAPLASTGITTPPQSPRGQRLREGKTDGGTFIFTNEFILSLENVFLITYRYL